MYQTPLKKFILSTLQAAESALSVPDIAILAKEAGLDYNISSFYRQLQKLIQDNLVSEYKFSDGVSKFEIKKENSRNHFHLICQSCKKNFCINIENDILNKLLNLGDNSSVIVQKVNLEFEGVCKNCSSSSIQKVLI
jgi:Fur family ferric uptake transcriptional regulator